MRANAYSRERLGHLLGLLPAAPERWVTAAQAVIVEALARDRTASDERPLSETQLAQLEHALERDPQFRVAFDSDPIAAAEAAGWSELARGLEREMRQLVALAERIAAESSFRSAIDTDPMRTLGAAGIDPVGVGPLLDALGRSDAEMRMPDVVAHQHEHLSLTSRLTILLLRSRAFADHLCEVAGPRAADSGLD